MFKPLIAVSRPVRDRYVEKIKACLTYRKQHPGFVGQN